jgi:hypothetical protein
LGATEAQATAFKRLYREWSNRGDAGWAELVERDAYMLRVHAAAGGLLSVEHASFLAWNSFHTPHTRGAPVAWKPLSTQAVVHTLVRLRDVAQAHGLSLVELTHNGELVELLTTAEEDGAAHRLNDALETLSFLPTPVLRVVVRSMFILDVSTLQVDAMRMVWATSHLSKLSQAELLQESHHPRFESYVTNMLC